MSVKLFIVKKLIRTIINAAKNRREMEQLEAFLAYASLKGVKAAHGWGKSLTQFSDSAQIAAKNIFVACKWLDGETERVASRAVSRLFALRAEFQANLTR